MIDRGVKSDLRAQVAGVVGISLGEFFKRRRRTKLFAKEILVEDQIERGVFVATDEWMSLDVRLGVWTFTPSPAEPLIGARDGDSVNWRKVLHRQELLQVD